MYFKKKLKQIIKNMIFEKYEKFEYCTFEYFTNLTENKNESYKIFKKKLNTVKKKLDALISKNQKDDENYSSIYSSLISIKKKVTSSNHFYKDFKTVLEKIKKIDISIDFNQKELLKLIKVTSTNLKKKEEESKIDIKIDSQSENSLFKSKKSLSKEISKKKEEESFLLIDENLNGLKTERLEHKNDTQILDDTLKETPEQNNKSFIKFQNAHKIKNFSPIKKKKNFIKVNSMMNFNSYSSVKRKQKMPRRISKASINLKKTNPCIEDEIEIHLDQNMLKNDIYSKSKKDSNSNYNTIYSKIKNSNRNQRSRKKKMTSKRKTLVLPQKKKLGSLSRRPSQNRDRNAYLKTHYNNLNLKSDYIGLKIDQEKFQGIIKKEILKKSQRVNFNGNQFFCDVIEELKGIIDKPFTNAFLIDLRRNNIEFSSRIDEDIEDFKNFNVKIII